MHRLCLICCCIAVLGIASRAQTPRASQTPIPETNPFSSEADVQQGAALFQVHCTYCHGASGEGGESPEAGVFGSSDIVRKCTTLVRREPV